MSQLVLNIEDASLIPSLKKILGAIKGVTICKPQKDSFRVDPYEISPSGDTFFADSRNVKAVEEDIAKAHQPGAKFTRLENKEDITAFINSLQEMAYAVLLSEQAKEEIATIKKSGDKPTIKKITNMLLELQEHPRTGTGQVEHLKHYVFEETWSRRINKQYRMIYEIHDAEVYVTVISLRSHYGQK